MSEETKETVEAVETKAEETTTETVETKTEPETPAAEETKTEATEEKAEESKEPELTIDSYADLGFKAEDGISINEDSVKSFKEIALKHKISPEAAKEIATLQMDSARKQQEDFKALQKSWEAENQKKYGDNLKNVETNVARVLTELDKSGEFAKLLDLAGAKKHPATLAFLKSIGEQLLEKPSVNANATAPAKEKTLADFY